MVKIVGTFLIFLSFLCGNNAIAAQSQSSRTLVAYFSRYDNSTSELNLDVLTMASAVRIDGRFQGSTAFIAHEIASFLNADVYSIKTQEKLVSGDDALIGLNHREQEARTKVKLETLPDVSGYDTIFVGFPIWAMSAPRAVLSFLESLDLQDKKIIPFCTHDGFGAGRSVNQIVEAASGADVAINILTVDSDSIEASSSQVKEYLQANGFLNESAKNITIKVNGHELHGVLYDTPLSDEISKHFPLTVSMSGFGDREYYGSVDFIPETKEQGQLFFENGDITFCFRNNTLAVFYNQSSGPNLSMEVIPIGKVTGDLEVFHNLPAYTDITFSFN